MYQHLNVEIKGVSPLLLHNGQLADPLNQYTRALKQQTSKRKKTDVDLMEIRRLEWEGGFYRDDQDRPCIPGENIEGP